MKRPAWFYNPWKAHREAVAACKESQQIARSALKNSDEILALLKAKTSDGDIGEFRSNINTDSPSKYVN